MKRNKWTVPVLAGTMAASLLFTGCGNRIDQDAVVATLGDKEISLGLANFMAQYQAVSYDSYMLSYYGEDMWSQDVSGSGSTLTEDVKSSALEELETDYLLEQHMDDYGVEITDEEMTAIENAAKQFMKDNEGDAADTMGATEEYVAEMLRLSLIQQKMETAIEAEVDTEVSDEEAAQRTFSYIHVSTDSYTDADGNTVEYTEDELAALPDKMAELATAAKTDFDGAAEEYGYDVSTYSYGSDEDSMDEAVITAADALSEGEVSDLITTEENGYYVLRLDSEFDEEATETKKESIVSERKSDHYTEVTDGYKEDADWEVDEDVWADVNFDELYTIKSDDTEASTDTEALNSTEAATDTGTVVNTEAITGTEAATE